MQDSRSKPTRDLDSRTTPSKQVLFVDDDPAVRRSVARFLSRANVSCQIAAGPNEALKTLNADPFGFGVVVSDYQMPETDGVSFLTEVAVKTPWTTRILLSGQLDLDDALAAVNSGAVFRIVTKPVVPTELIDLVRNSLERASLARRNAALLTELRRRNTELTAERDRLRRMMSDRTIALLDVLAATLDLRVDGVSGQSRRLAAYAKRLAEQLNLPAESLHAAEYGALLRDIGAATAPQAILDGSTSLSVDDRARLVEHHAQGAERLRAIEFFQGAAEVVRHQLERYDGRGLPDGLKGNEIPIGARILHVVKVLEALTGTSGSRPARGLDWAREEIRRQAGTALDPEVVDGFEQIQDEEWAEILMAQTGLKIVA